MQLTLTPLITEKIRPFSLRETSAWMREVEQCMERIAEGQDEGIKKPNSGT